MNKTRAERGRNLTPLERNRKYLYGITPEDFDDILIRQNGKCIICGTEKPNGEWHVDHSHETGRVRGLLCLSCNVTIGYIEKNIQFLDNILAYIKT